MAHVTAKVLCLPIGRNRTEEGARDLAHTAPQPGRKTARGVRSPGRCREAVRGDGAWTSLRSIPFRENSSDFLRYGGKKISHTGGLHRAYCPPRGMDAAGRHAAPCVARVHARAHACRTAARRSTPHSVAPPLRENPIALIHGVNALRHRALAASGCPGPKVCRL